MKYKKKNKKGNNMRKENQKKGYKVREGNQKAQTKDGKK